MTRSQLTAVVLAVITAVAVPKPADAQLGNLIKKKVKEAVKPPEKTNPVPQPAPTAAAPASAAQAESNSRDPFASQRVPGERALLISDEMIARLYRGLDAEAAMIKDLEKEIAAYPTPQQIQACKQKAAMTPEGQKYLNPGNFLKEGMKPDELQAAMMKMTTESDAYFKKACPWNESKWSDYNRSEARRAIRTKAAAQALPPSAGGASPRSSHLMFDVDTSTVITKGLAGVGLEENEFGEMVERILYYCELKKTMDVKPKSGGIKVPGSGRDIYWIYTESELKVLQKFDCDAFKKKYANLLGAYA